MDPLKPEYASVIREVDLKERPVIDVAGELKTTSPSASTATRHQLRERMEQTCQPCSKHGCLNCTCQ